MAAHISTAEAQAWLETTKLDITTLDTELEVAISLQVLSRLAVAFDVTQWTSNTSTPKLVRKIIAMMYAAAYYNRQYSEEEGTNQYADQLHTYAMNLIKGILEGSVIITDGDPSTAKDFSTPIFYPTDESSNREPTSENPSLGPRKFSMGTIW